MNHKPIPPALRASTITVLQSFCDSPGEGLAFFITYWIVWIILAVAQALPCWLMRQIGRLAHTGCPVERPWNEGGPSLIPVLIPAPAFTSLCHIAPVRALRVNRSSTLP